jgi:hypothetical protein
MVRRVLRRASYVSVREPEAETIALLVSERIAAPHRDIKVYGDVGLSTGEALRRLDGALGCRDRWVSAGDILQVLPVVVVLSVVVCRGPMLRRDRGTQALWLTLAFVGVGVTFNSLPLYRWTNQITGVVTAGALGQLVGALGGSAGVRTTTKYLRGPDPAVAVVGLDPLSVDLHSGCGATDGIPTRTG